MEHSISFFDLDHTLLHVNCSFHFGLYLYKKKIIGVSSLAKLLWYYFLHKCGLLDICGIHRKSFNSLFRSRENREFREYGFAFVEECYDRLINTDVFEVLLEKKRKGETVMILSSSPDFLVEAFARKMGVANCFATIYQTDDSGRYISIDRVLEGGEKAKLVHQILLDHEIPFENTSGYSDSHHDLAFLESVAHPVAVNPNKTLLKVCEERGWNVLVR